MAIFFKIAFYVTQDIDLQLLVQTSLKPVKRLRLGSVLKKLGLATPSFSRTLPSLNPLNAGKKQPKNFWKKSILLPKGLIFEISQSKMWRYSGLKYRICENLNKIGSSLPYTQQQDTINRKLVIPLVHYIFVYTLGSMYILC